MKTSRVLLMAAAGLFLLAQPQMMHAASVLVDFSASYNDVTAPPFPFTDNTDPAAVTQATGPLNGSLTHYSTSSTATANFGSLLVNTAASGVSDENVNSHSKAGWVDSLTILGSGQGTLKLYFTLSGSLAAADGGGSSVATGTYAVNGDVNGNFFARVGTEHSNIGLIGFALTDFSVTTGDFTFGTPFSFNISLEGSAGYGGDTGATSDSASASNVQLTLVGIEVYDFPSNTLVSSPSISSASGVVYAVPEPSRAVLLLLGAGALLCRRRKS
ncbi:PEP-CTERM sorting domain-containing protein [Prosthecobacter sp.]|uniref:PEP-CTERM sorting domain-containing protein n=1 Tax=Prosthecobacter sp. TaxID=1965333 RepID=UPI002AB9E660|nr:PEP-CTERM sorting domain-containing protein [Prosthecobacter sp.]MDZ4403126.1 PEP-CTERM sorting domain-containing protein [Prosthecobacter sp.]